MIIETNISECARSFEYVENHHYVRLEDDSGNDTVLLEKALVRYWCPDCTYIFYAASNMGKWCPSCGHAGILRQWVRPQVAFVPEKESDFRPKIKPKPIEDEDTKP